MVIYVSTTTSTWPELIVQTLNKTEIETNEHNNLGRPGISCTHLPSLQHPVSIHDSSSRLLSTDQPIQGFVSSLYSLSSEVRLKDELIMVKS